MRDRYDRIGLYNDRADPRLIVPKRNPALGWTINVGRARGRAALVVLVGTVAAGIVAAITFPA